MIARLAVFASGFGSNAKNIHSYFSSSDIARVVLFCSNNVDSGVVSYSKKHQISCCLFSRAQLNDPDFLPSILAKKSIDMIVLAGFLLKIPEKLICLYSKKIVNLHPSLLPKYGGRGMYGDFVHSAVIKAREVESGITIHYVNQSYDEGEVVFQEKCCVSKKDTVDSLKERVRKLEHRFFPVVIEKLILNNY